MEDLCDAGQNVAWARALGNWGHIASDGNAATLNRSTGGLLLGADTQIDNHWRAGVMGGFSQTKFSNNERGSGSSTDYHLGVYAGGQWDALALRTGAAYTWHDISANRSVAFPGFADSLKAKYHAGTAQVFGEVGYGVQAGAVKLEPFANLAYVNLSTGGFTEQGGAAALSSKSSSTGTAFSTLGLHASTNVDFGGGVQATAKGTLGWRHAFGNTTPTSQMALSGGNAFTVAGVPVAKNAAVLDAGLDFKVGKNTTLGVSYNGQFGSGVRDNGVRANLQMKF
jgi:outer membrane autotransporter protein